MGAFRCSQSLALIFAIVVASALGPTEADARLRTTESTKYFDITGSSAAELHRSLRRAHSSFNALTKWHARTNYTWKVIGKQCKLTNVTVTLRLDVLLPRLKPGTKLSPDVQKRWDRFAAAIVVHEAGHVKLYKSAASELDRKLSSFSSPCRTVEHDAGGIDRAGFDRMQKINDEYDERTDGGTRQGATLD